MRLSVGKFLILFALLFGMAGLLSKIVGGTTDSLDQDTVVVQPAPDIEVLWAIEDERVESESPLVTYLENHGSPLGYDAASNTFYCTLGLETGTQWPEIVITAPENPEVSICFSDDYTYDWCDQAIEEGYAYELMAYTESEYQYFYMVFTGLPIVTISTQQELTEEYVPTFTSISAAEYEPIRTYSKTHIRGAMSAEMDKKSYRIEFHRINQQGKDKKNKLSVLGMEEDSDWLLLANTMEETGMRSFLAWEMWKMWNPDGNAFGLLESQMVELFINDEYCGLYQLMQRMDTDREIERMGGNLNTDCAFRILSPYNIKDRLVKDYKSTADVHLEIRKPPHGYTESESFSILDDYSRLADIKEGKLSEEEFIEYARKNTDVERIMSYFLFSQAASLWQDNIYNNLYVWAVKKGSSYQYTYSPWDLDRAFYLSHAECHKPLLEGKDDICVELYVPCRLLDIDGLNSREIAWKIWNEKRAGILNDDALYQWFYDVESMINRSGAYVRDTEKWKGGGVRFDVQELCNYTIGHVGTVERFMLDCWPINSQSDTAEQISTEN